MRVNSNQLVQTTTSNVVVMKRFPFIDGEEDGHDELNLAEWPLSIALGKEEGYRKVLQDSFWDSIAKRQVTRRIVLKAKQPELDPKKDLKPSMLRTKAITSRSDSFWDTSLVFGFPDATDEDFILALIQLTLRQINPARQLNFLPVDVLEVMGRSRAGTNYARLVCALERFHHLTIQAQRAWWSAEVDDKEASWEQDIESFRIIDAYRISDVAGAESSITWGERFYSNLVGKRALKRLNFKFYWSLSRELSKRMYRFLDKRFRGASKRELTFLLSDLQIHLGLSENLKVAEIRKYITRALDELRERGYLASVTFAGRGLAAEVTLSRASVSVVGVEENSSLEENDSFGEFPLVWLTHRPYRVSSRALKAFVRKATPEKILAWENAKDSTWIKSLSKQVVKNLGGYIAKMLDNGDIPPSQGEKIAPKPPRPIQLELPLLKKKTKTNDLEAIQATLTPEQIEAIEEEARRQTTDRLSRLSISPGSRGWNECYEAIRKELIVAASIVEKKEVSVG
jgi:hypothetical protein